MNKTGKNANPYAVGAIGATNFGMEYPKGGNGGYYSEVGTNEKDNVVSYKYNEYKYLNEISDYIDRTYNQHYSQNKFQATEFIIDSGHGAGFCIGNVLKYAQRYGRKGDRDEWRKDLMKVIHYAIIQLHVHDSEGNNNGN